MAEKNQHVFTDEDVSEIRALLEKRKKKGMANGKKEEEFKTNLIESTYNEKFKFSQKTLHVSIARKTGMNFIAFIQSLRVVFTYLLNVARASTSSEDDYVRFIFSHAPKSYFSTAVLRFKDFDVNFLLNIFEKMMQSNRTLIADGWETNVVIQTFPRTYSKNKKTKKQLGNKKKIYRRLGFGVSDDGGGVGKNVEKYGRDQRMGVFYTVCDGLNKIIKNCCFARR